jgi:Peptidase S46
VRKVISCVPILFFLAMPGFAEEGMWTFDNVPVKQLKDQYNFTPTPEWLDHVRLSSVRMNDGGSGSFVSPHGLVLTNHHVAMGQLQKVSTDKKDYVKDGFYAARQADELKCPDMEVNQLVSMENVTARVQGVVKTAMSDKDAFAARQAEIAKITRESQDKTGLRSDVVTLYQGGEYWLYRYKKFTDVRLVFAPEKQSAFFGGDFDNFTYPRYALDMALFRVYENGKPVATKDYLKWNARGPAADELVFVSGNPGSTSRQDTMAQIDTQREYFLPLTIQNIKRQLDVLRRYSALGSEQARQATDRIFGLENSLKVLNGMYDGLKDRALIAQKQKSEQDFRALVNARPEWRSQYGDAWDAIAAAEKKYRERYTGYANQSLSARLPNTALQLVIYVAETRKPDGQRLPGFHDAQLESLRFRLLSSAPVYPHMDERLLASDLSRSLAGLGRENPYVKAVLGGGDPAEVAKAALEGTKLGDPKVRKALLEGGESAVAASTDPLIVLARKIEPFARERIRWVEDNVQSIETPAGEKIGKARFAVYGKSAYPDATFTLRLSYGTVTGYPMNGTKAPPFTTFYGLYDRSIGFGMKPPFDLPQRFVERRDRLDLSTKFNFICSCDVVGGNSGSPVIDRNGDLVGLVFDGNIESLVGDYVYNGANNRTLAVDAAAMIEALRKLYDAAPLADELQARPGS